MVSSAATLERRPDPRVARTQKLIRDAFTSLLGEKTFEAVSVQDIAERATVNRATFYAHYPDKFALAESMIREDAATRLLEGDPLKEADTRKLLLAVAKNVFAYVASHRECRIDRDFEIQLAKAMEIELGAFLQPTFEHCTALLVASALVGSAMNWRRDAPKMDPTPMMGYIVDVLIDGVKRA
jgi:AcrR family transcriptional regulator